MTSLFLTLKSIKNRWFTATLTIVSIALSVTLLLGVERINKGAKSTFQNTISGTDLLVGARTGGVQLLLYSVFRIGNATNNISWESYQHFANHPEVNWAIPISLGDSHRGYRVMGTSKNYFEFYRYANKRKLSLKEGKEFEDLFDAVLGAEVAKELGYQVGTNITLSHGLEQASFQNHKDKPFTVVGILEKTGTPVDRTVHVSLQAIKAIHIGWEKGAPPRKGENRTAQQVRSMDLTPEDVTAALFGLKSRIGIFRLQREINDYDEEALMAVLPGITFQQLWETVGVAETALRIVSLFVVLTGLLGMLTSILTSLNERRREMAILRSVGAKPFYIFLLLVSEATLLCSVGVALGVSALYLGLWISQPIVESQFGLFVPIEWLSSFDLGVLLVVLAAGFLVGCVPAWKAYRTSLSDGLTIRV